MVSLHFKRSNAQRGCVCAQFASAPPDCVCVHMIWARTLAKTVLVYTWTQVQTVLVPGYTARAIALCRTTRTLRATPAIIWTG
eukprot:2118279-Lingulodinium_polyedra.AAC.1